MRIKSIILPDDSVINPGTLNLFIGPNNSGKTQILKDLLSCGISKGARPTVVKGVELEQIISVDKDILASTHRGTKRFSGQKTDIIRGLGSNLASSKQADVSLSQYESLKNPIDAFTFGHEILGMQFGFLDAESRLQMVKQSPSHNSQIEAPESLLQALFVDQSGAEAKLNEVFEQAFRRQIRLDYSGMNSLCLRVGRNLDEISSDPRVMFLDMQKRRLLEAEGEGMKSFAAVVLSVLLCSSRILLIDEPEAFLHPAHAKILGRWISEKASESNNQIFLSTHSASILTGLTSLDSPVSITRLCREGMRTQFACIEAPDLKALSTSPLLSSQRVIEALFHRSVVLCEADADRITYETVANQYCDGLECQFVFAHNKQSLKFVARLLYNAKVPVSVIADLDLINSESELVDLVNEMCKKADIAEIKKLRSTLEVQYAGQSEMELIELLKAELQAIVQTIDDGANLDLSKLRSSVRRAEKKASKSARLKKEGLQAFDDTHQQICGNLLNLLSEIGIFLVPVGELEGWISLEANKQNWVVNALTEIVEGRAPAGLICFVDKAVAFSKINRFDPGDAEYDPRKSTMRSTRPAPQGAYLI